MKDKKINTLLIGGGRIGALNKNYSDGLPGNYLSSIQNSKKFHLVGIVEPKPKSKIISSGVKIFKDINDVNKNYFDLVFLASSTESHFEVLRSLGKYKPKLVVAEKPLTTCLSNSLKIYNLYKKNKIEILVNFSRRFVDFYHSLKKEINSHRIISATIKYGKGIRNNGYHAIDILNFLLGNCKSIKPLARKNDYSNFDPSFTVFMEYERCNQVFLIGLDHRYFTHFEIEIFTNKKKYLISDDHQSCYVRSLLSKNNEKKFSKKKKLNTYHNFHFVNLINSAFDVFNRKKNKSDFENLLEVEKIVDYIEKYEMEKRT